MAQDVNTLYVSTEHEAILLNFQLQRQGVFGVHVVVNLDELAKVTQALLTNPNTNGLREAFTKACQGPSIPDKAPVGLSRTEMDPIKEHTPNLLKEILDELRGIKECVKPKDVSIGFETMEILSKENQQAFGDAIEEALRSRGWFEKNGLAYRKRISVAASNFDFLGGLLNALSGPLHEDSVVELTHLHKLSEPTKGLLMAILKFVLSTSKATEEERKNFFTFGAQGKEGASGSIHFGNGNRFGQHTVTLQSNGSLLVVTTAKGGNSICHYITPEGASIDLDFGTDVPIGK